MVETTFNRIQNEKRLAKRDIFIAEWAIKLVNDKQKGLNILFSENSYF